MSLGEKNVIYSRLYVQNSPTQPQLQRNKKLNR